MWFRVLHVAYSALAGRGWQPVARLTIDPGAKPNAAPDRFASRPAWVL
jgi:hypothetical protein